MTLDMYSLLSSILYCQCQRQRLELSIRRHKVRTTSTEHNGDWDRASWSIPFSRCNSSLGCSDVAQYVLAPSPAQRQQGTARNDTSCSRLRFDAVTC
ncbi:hypothetical protein HETIRDRAFT_477630 [Heterobasidion irregulare TC 32-1]|uniref:Uncharacterized protein n=1 Tax=Heterobasidion irregulare (strain TC 32-1) TaxID=747525 RepID=W4K2S8_HETIT|nr:uncharacterized protein HETIRDRAFT_477630 [Heterobasidion irregulare TC 32-1]ETW80039.1 hypothetical protein HETIRDRAFT_477630 [Heterobasidion irregulare TC 32-1]